MLLEFDSLEREHKQILQAIKGYYEQFPGHEAITPDELQIFFHQENPVIKDTGVYDILFDQIRSINIDNSALLDTALKRVTDFHYSTKAMGELVKFLNAGGKAGIETILPLIDEYRSVVSAVGEENPDECITPLRQIIEDIKRDGLDWSLDFLNSAIGPVYPGTLGHILARPEVGKTAFCVSQASFFAYQLRKTNEKVLFLSNEEGVNRTRARAYASLIGLPVDTLLQDKEDQYEQLYLEKGGKNLVFVGEVGTLAKVEQNIARYKPRVVIVDQGPKVSLPGNYSSVEARQLVYNAYRTMASRNRLVFITVGQADSAAENKKWLTYNHIDGSKVGIPGECDYIIGIGRSEEKEDHRYFCISKNKLGIKLGRYPAKIDPLKNRYIQI